jgi:hypothetical protein
MWDDFFIALLTERFFIILLCTFFKARDYMGFIICMKYNRYTTNNREPLWSGRGANPPFYSTQSSHDTLSSEKNKMSSPTPNQNEKYPTKE